MLNVAQKEIKKKLYTQKNYSSKSISDSPALLSLLLIKLIRLHTETMGLLRSTLVYFIVSFKIYYYPLKNNVE